MHVYILTFIDEICHLKNHDLVNKSHYASVKLNSSICKNGTINIGNSLPFLTDNAGNSIDQRAGVFNTTQCEEFPYKKVSSSVKNAFVENASVKNFQVFKNCLFKQNAFVENASVKNSQVFKNCLFKHNDTQGIRPDFCVIDIDFDGVISEQGSSSTIVIDNDLHNSVELDTVNAEFCVLNDTNLCTYDHVNSIKNNLMFLLMNFCRPR
jgi:hypothetical protein